MIGVSWPLWVGSEFPRVPFVSGWVEGPAWLSWLAVASVGWGAMGPGWRVALSAGLILIGFEVLGDQSRLQPWVYQFGLVGFALVMAPGPRALGLARVYAISLYAYSGLSKLDESFVRELGPTFLAAGLAPLGISPEGWPGAARVAAVLAMPAWEVAVAVGLSFAKARRPAWLGAVAQHLALVAILGPRGLGHSANVLIWNLAMIAEGWLLFWPKPVPSGDPATWRGRVASGVFGLAVLCPLGERWGLCDSWPGHALYASHAERAEVFVHEDDSDRLPPSAARWLGPADVDGWRKLDLTGWSRDVRGVPGYPQARVGLGIAEALGAIPGGSRPVRVVLWGRAGFWDGRRGRIACVGPAAMARQAAHYAVNAHPSPGAGRW